MTATKENCSEGFCSVQFLVSIKSADTPKVIGLYKKLFKLEDTIAAGPTQQRELEKLKKSSAYLELEQQIKVIVDAQGFLQRRIDLAACPICPYSSPNIMLREPDLINLINIEYNHS